MSKANSITFTLTPSFFLHLLYLQFSITMPRLSLGKGLFPSIGTWKSFTTKLFRKLHPRKMINIAKTRRPKTNIYHPPLPSKKNPLRRKAKKRHQLFGVSKASLHRPKRQRHFKKRPSQAPPPVFIDELFSSCRNEVCSVSTLGKGVHNTCSGDEMWESVGLGSPQMRGIDARAEEFIARFRADLEFQEIVAHHL